MDRLETIALMASILCLSLSVASAIWQFAASRGAAMAASSGTSVVAGARAPRYASLAMILASVACISVAVVARAVSTGHGPFSSMYEFSIAFAWGTALMGAIFSWRYRLPALGTAGALIALGLLVAAEFMPSRSSSLVPALQQSALLTTHVASAVISYGSFAVGFGASIIYLAGSHSQRDSEILDRIGYQSVLVGFPFMTLVIVLGALWADIAWGRYWSWDPKETASLVTWLLYVAYLHVRVMRGWRGRGAAIFLVVGFVAVLVTFFGNYVFKGLHSYT